MKRGSLRRTHPTEGESIEFSLEMQDNRLILQLSDETVELEIFQGDSHSGWCRWQGRTLPFAYELIGEEVHIWLDGDSFTFVSGDRRLPRQARIPKGMAGPDAHAAVTPEADSSAITSRISGLVLVVCVGIGDTVSAGDEVCVIEAMKMEHSIRSNYGGVVGEVLIQENQQVSAGDVLISFERESG